MPSCGRRRALDAASSPPWPAPGSRSRAAVSSSPSCCRRSTTEARGRWSHRWHFAAGAGLAAYAASTARVLAGRRDGRAVAVLLVLVMVAATFWTTATVAQWWGRGEARTLAADLRSLPAVVLDSQERLYPGNDAIGFQDLAPTTPPAGAEEPSVPAETMHRYRYSGLRLLVRGDGALYLVPDVWSPDASTLVIPDDQDVRIRYRFLPDAAG